VTKAAVDLSNRSVFFLRALRIASPEIATKSASVIYARCCAW
jgi:hypothetical protein